MSSSSSNNAASLDKSEGLAPTITIDEFGNIHVLSLDAAKATLKLSQLSEAFVERT